MYYYTAFITPENKPTKKSSSLGRAIKDMFDYLNLKESGEQLVTIQVYIEPLTLVREIKKTIQYNYVPKGKFAWESKYTWSIVQDPKYIEEREKEALDLIQILKEYIDMGLIEGELVFQEFSEFSTD